MWHGERLCHQLMNAGAEGLTHAERVGRVSAFPSHSEHSLVSRTLLGGKEGKEGEYLELLR